MDKKALFNLTYGMYVVSTLDGDRNVGCVVNSVMQISSSPATLAISINKDNYTNPCLLKSKKFAISILSENTSEGIIGVFGFKSSQDTDKFENTDFELTKNGIPILKTESCAYIECSVINSVDCFTHTLVIAEITDAQNITAQQPMTYSYYHKVIKGKSPKNAPTYVEEKTGNGKYVCSVCGYEYPGSIEEFEALPDSYECPLCAAAKSMFELIEGK